MSAENTAIAAVLVAVGIVVGFAAWTYLAPMISTATTKTA